MKGLWTGLHKPPDSASNLENEVVFGLAVLVHFRWPREQSWAGPSTILCQSRFRHQTETEE
jgi:hypothetical protein